MPQSPESPAGSTLRRVTGVIARHQAAQLDVCRAGTEVALHISTRQGVVIIQLPEVAFVKGCRGAVDFNGNPFRTIEQIREAMLTPEEKAAAHIIRKPGGKIL